MSYDPDQGMSRKEAAVLPRRSEYTLHARSERPRSAGP